MRTVSLLRQRFPFVGILCAAIAGILLASWLGATWWLFFALLSLFLLKLPLRKQGGLCWSMVVVAFAVMQAWNWSESPARRLAGWFDVHPGEFLVQGIVTAEPKTSSSGSSTFPMRVEVIRETGDTGTTVVRAPISVLVRWPGDPPVCGDRVSFEGEAVRPEAPRNPGAMDYRRWLERHGIFTQFRIDPSDPGRIDSGGHGNPLTLMAIKARHRMEQLLGTDLEGAPDVMSAIKGITLGVTEHAPEGFTDDFRFTGTMHLFAVSGLHVGMLAVIIWFALKAVRVPRNLAVGITIPALFFYVLITGMKMGSIRSATMASILLLGLMFFRNSPMLNTLAAAAFIQLAVDGNALFSAGWQFSYSVVASIILLAAPIGSWVRRFHEPDPFLPPRLIKRSERLGFQTWRHFAELSGVSASAWIGSLIPTVAYFHLVSLSAFGANLLAVPLAFGVISLGALSLLGGSFSLWIAGAFNNANWLVTKLLLLVVQGSAMIPGGHWFVGFPHLPYPEMTLLDLKGDSCAVIRSQGEFALVNAGGKRSASGTLLPFLEYSGANALKSVLITKADAAHVGGLPMVRKEIPVAKILLADSPVHSAVAKSVLSTLDPIPLSPGMPTPLAKGVVAELLVLSGGPSPVLRIMLGESRVLILPSADRELLSSLKGCDGESLRADVLILPLGGAEFVSTLDLIGRVLPKSVITPVYSFRRDGVPSSEWQRLLEEKGVKLFREDESGAVTITSLPGMSGQAVVTRFLEESRTKASDQ